MSWAFRACRRFWGSISVPSRDDLVVFSFSVAHKANPYHVQRFGIVAMVRLNAVCGATIDTRAFLETAAFKRPSNHGVSCVFFRVTQSSVHLILSLLGSTFRCLVSLLFILRLLSPVERVRLTNIVFCAFLALAKMAIAHLWMTVKLVNILDAAASKTRFCSVTIH